MKHFDRDHLPAPESAWGSFEKRATTRACRISGPFSVTTSEGEMIREDGWLALDVKGNPYPIERAVFEESYREAHPVMRP